METVNTAILFDPYLDTLGGGERYTLTIAQILLDQGWQVDLAWKDLKTIEAAKKRFGLPLKNLNVSGEYYNLFSQKSSLGDRYTALKNIDLVFIVSDGSVPILFGKKTFLHYQVPFLKTNTNFIFNKIKLLTVNKIIANSKFTKKVIDKTLFTNKSQVLYPPIDVDSFKRSRKTNTILNVGRFSSPSHSKRQDILINVFKQLVDDGLKDWQLVLVGAQFGSAETIEALKDSAKGYPIKFEINPPLEKLQTFYAEASIYWHAAGFEVDEKLNPESVEHFGMTTVEAMAAGCVPIVHKKGGQKEIIEAGSGFLWDTLDELKNITLKIIGDHKTAKKISLKAETRAKHFSTQNFKDNFLALLK